MVILVADLADTVMGIVRIFYARIWIFYPPSVMKFITSYDSISLSLSILLTIMIITRLALHKRNIQRAMGTSDETTKFYITIIMMLVKSYALYSITSISYIVSLSLGAPVCAIFSELLSRVQVCASCSCADMSQPQNAI